MIFLDQEFNPFISTGNTGPYSALSGNGYARYTPNAAIALTEAPDAGAALHPQARHAIISVLTNPIRVRTDGTDPTASEGLLVPAGTLIYVRNSPVFLQNFKMIDTAAGASEVTVMYGV